MNCTDAANQLRAMQLKVDVKGNPFEQQFGHVENQNPEPNIPVQPGQDVAIRCKL
jgi:beta-lactam-binding protein with PASTA domain